jgi:hypothetical protein
MLTVITHTRFKNPLLLERCKLSVAAALPEGAQHLIIPCFENFAQARFDASQLSEYVAFVDDDDFVAPDAIRQCLTALKATGASIAFTNEATVNIHGDVLYTNQASRAYQHVSEHPRAIHHLSVMNSTFISPKTLEINDQFGAGICWFIKASAALTGSAIHVPMQGYYWTRHADVMLQAESYKYNHHIKEMGVELRKAFPHPGGRIPTWVPVTN